MSNFYKLVFIKGISRLDTWKFNSKEQQYDYFDGLPGEKIDDYFPPYYSNSIRLSFNDVDYTSSKYNYLLLYFNNKYYCYFIDGIKYINEDVYTLEITMDDIQTRMFDIQFLNSTVDRRSIKRWTKDDDGYYINRNYNRENLSKEDFINYSYENYTFNKTLYLLIKASEVRMTNPSDFYLLTSVRSKYNNVLSNGFYYCILPLPKNVDVNSNVIKSYIKLYNNNYQQVGNEEHFYNFDLQSLIASDYVLDVTVVNETFLDAYIERIITSTEYVYSDGIKICEQHNDIRFYSNSALFWCKIPAGDTTACDALVINCFENDFRRKECTPFNLIRNNRINQPFNSIYIPALLDENYIHLYFGEKTNFTTYPLSKSINKNFSLYYFYDILTNERCYRIGDQGGFDYDEYNTTITSTSQESLELKNSPWENYVSQNKATLTTGRYLNIAMSAFDTGADLAGFGIKNYKKKGLFLKAGGLGVRGVRALSNPYLEAIGAVSDVVKDQIDLAVTKDNLQHAPNTERQGNNYSSDLINQSVDLINSIERVKDFDNVGKLIEYYGYAVDETYTNENLFNIGCRHYYNFIKTTNLKIETIEGIIPQIELKGIEERFNDGLRLWNFDNNTNMCDNLKYDNVEEDFIDEE